MASFSRGGRKGGSTCPSPPTSVGRSRSRLCFMWLVHGCLGNACVTCRSVRNRGAPKRNRKQIKQGVRALVHVWPRRCLRRTWAPLSAQHEPPVIRRIAAVRICRRPGDVPVDGANKGSRLSSEESEGSQRGAVPSRNTAPRCSSPALPPHGLQIGASEWPVGVCGGCFPAAGAAPSVDNSRQGRSGGASGSDAAPNGLQLVYDKN